MSKFSAAIVPIVSIGVGVVLLSVAYAATNTDSAAQSPGPNPPALEKNERQMERATKVRAAKQKRAAKAHWAHLARVKAEKARQAELALRRDRCLLPAKPGFAHLPRGNELRPIRRQVC